MTEPKGGYARIIPNTDIVFAHEVKPGDVLVIGAKQDRYLVTERDSYMRGSREWFNFEFEGGSISLASPTEALLIREQQALFTTDQEI